MTKRDTLEKCLEWVLTMKRIHSKNCAAQIPEDGMDEEYDMYSIMAQHIREMMIERRFGPSAGDGK